MSSGLVTLTCVRAFVESRSGGAIGIEPGVELEPALVRLLDGERQWTHNGSGARPDGR